MLTERKTRTIRKELYNLLSIISIVFEIKLHFKKQSQGSEYL